MEVTQWLNYGELFNQTETQIKSWTEQGAEISRMKDRFTSGAGIIPGMAGGWKSIAKRVLGDVAKNVWKSKKLGYDSTKMAAQWNSLYPDFNSSSKTDFYTLYGDWSSEISAANKVALEASNIQAENFSSEQNDVAAIQKIVDDANTQESQIAVANAANRVALANLDEMRKLRQLQILQNTAQTTYLQGKSGEEKRLNEESLTTLSGAGNKRPPCRATNNCTAKDLEKKYDQAIVII